MIYIITCENCGKTFEIETENLKEAEEKSENIKCC